MGKIVDDICKNIVKTGLKITDTHLVEGSWGNISAKIEGKQMIAITPSGHSYTSLHYKDIALLTYTGEIKESKYLPSSETALHLEIYKNRHDIRAVIHTHSIYASACAVAQMPILPIMEDMVQVVGGQVDVAKYALPGTKKLAINALDALADRHAVLLSMHGLVSCGRNLTEALTVANLVEKTAMIMIFAKQLNPNLKTLSGQDIKILHKFYLEKYSKIQLVEE